MKLALVLSFCASTLLSAMPVFAGEPEAGGDAFVSCYGDHHGSYLDFYINQDGTKVTITVSDDSAVNYQDYAVDSMKLDGAQVASKDQSKVLLDAVGAMNASEGDLAGFVLVKATASLSTGHKSEMYLNLNKMDQTSYVVIDGYVEPLTCRIIEH